MVTEKREKKINKPKILFDKSGNDVRNTRLKGDMQVVAADDLICLFLACVSYPFSCFSSTLHLLSSFSVMKVKDGLVLLVYSAVRACARVMNESCPGYSSL